MPWAKEEAPCGSQPGAEAQSPGDTLEALPSLTKHIGKLRPGVGKDARCSQAWPRWLPRCGLLEARRWYVHCPETMHSHCQPWAMGEGPGSTLVGSLGPHTPLPSQVLSVARDSPQTHIPVGWAVTSSAALTAKLTTHLSPGHLPCRVFPLPMA